MDPHLRWLRRLVVARVLERLAAETILVAVVVGAGVAGARATPIEIGLAAAAAVVAWPTGRLGLALATNPVGHRYLLGWTDPSAGLRVAQGQGPTAVAVARALDDAGFRFLARLRGSGGLGPTAVDALGPPTDAGDDPPPGLDLFQADGGRLLAVHSDDGELTVLSRLDDGRLLVTSEGFVPPVRPLVVNRLGATRTGDREPDRGSLDAGADGGGVHDAVGRALLAHVDRLLQLRRLGIEAVATGPPTVAGLARVEWQAWQELGPFLGPLVAIDGRRPGLRLQVRVPAETVLDRTAAADPSGRNQRTEPAAGAAAG